MAALRAVGLRVGEVSQADVDAPAGLVQQADPTPGARAERGSAVDLVVASGSAPVPDVVGESTVSAAAQLARAGFRVSQSFRPTAAASPGRVVGQDPRGGLAPAGATVRIVIAEEPPPPSPSPSPSPPPASPTPSPSPTPAAPSPSPTPAPSPARSPAPTPSATPSPSPPGA